MSKNLFFALLIAFFCARPQEGFSPDLINARPLASYFFKTFWIINLYYNNNERKHAF